MIYREPTSDTYAAARRLPLRFLPRSDDDRQPVSRVHAGSDLPCACPAPRRAAGAPHPSSRDRLARPARRRCALADSTDGSWHNCGVNKSCAGRLAQRERCVETACRLRLRAASWRSWCLAAGSVPSVPPGLRRVGSHPRWLVAVGPGGGGSDDFLRRPQQA